MSFNSSSSVAAANTLSYLNQLEPSNVLTIQAQRAPTINDRRYKLGTIWRDLANRNFYCLLNVTANSANWYLLGGQSGQVSTLTGDSGTATPAVGNISLTTSEDLVSTASGSDVAFSLAANRTTVRFADVTLTATQVKALATTPIQLVAAPAAGNTLLFMGALFKLNYGGTNVFSEAGDNLGIKYTDAAGVQVSGTIESTGFIDQSADTYTNGVPAADAIVAASAAEAQALVLDNLGNNFAGNAADDNTVSIRVYYQVQLI